MYLTRFKKDLLKLLLSSVFIKTLQMLILPFYTREFVLEAFGYKALFTSFIGFSAAFCCLKYEQAIIISRDEKLTHNLFFICSLINISISLIITLLISLGVSRFLPNSLLWIEEIKWYIPLDFLLTGFLVLLLQWNTNYKSFTLISISNILSSAISIFLTISYLFLDIEDEFTFIINSVQAKFFTILFIFFILFVNNNLPDINKFKIEKMVYLLKRYNNFPKYGLIAGSLGNASFELPLLLMGIYFSSTDIGLFSIAKQIIMTPISFISETKSVIAKKSVSSKLTGNLSELIIAFLKKTIFTFSGAFILLALFGSFYFGFVFGEEYRIAGNYAQILSMGGYFILLSTPMIPLFSILEREDLRLKFSIFNITLKILPIIISGLIGDFKLAIIFIGISEVIIYLVKVHISLNLVGKSFKDILSFISYAFSSSLIPLSIIGLTFLVSKNNFILLSLSFIYISFNFLRESQLISYMKFNK